jgi:hypothetical protein
MVAPIVLHVVLCPAMLEEAPLRTQGIPGLAHDHQVFQLTVGFPMVSLGETLFIKGYT